MWYIILDTKGLGKKPLSLIRFDKKLVLWRDKDGKAVGMDNICPHRGAELSNGKTDGKTIQCPYHGFKFDTAGHCTSIPANGDKCIISSNYKVKTYKLEEKHDFIWLWSGEEQENYPPLPFFAIITPDFHYSQIKQIWKTHYTRAIENQLDVSHLSFVHRTTIGSENRTYVNGPYTEKTEDSIKIWVDNYHKQDDVKYKNDFSHLKNRMPSLEFRFPNIWLLLISNKMLTFAAFVPVDDSHTLMYIRNYHKITSLPVLKNVFSLINKIFSRIILNQDKKIVESQFPLRSYYHMPEKLISADYPITLFRRMLYQLENKEEPVKNLIKE